MNRHRLFVLGVLFAVAVPASSQQVEWKDPSPHATKMVTVEEGHYVFIIHPREVLQEIDAFVTSLPGR